MPGHSGAKLPGLTLAIPAYNEEATLEEVARAALAEAPALAERWELLIVDDASRDSTGAIADRLAAELPGVRAVHHPENRGFGGAQQTVFREAKEPWVTLVPADGQFPAGDLARFLPAAGEADIVLGCRSGRADPAVRRALTWGFGLFTRLALGLPLKDINWVKLYRTELVKDLSIESRRIGVDAEVIVKASLKGARFQEVKVGYLPRRAGEASSTHLPTVVRTLKELLTVWVKLRLGALR